MAFKEGSNLEHLQGVSNVIDNPEGYEVYGPFIWQEDIFKKENGIYRTGGRLILPMSIEGRNPIENREGRTCVGFTMFDRVYFEGLPVPDGEGRGYNSLCDWFPEMKTGINGDGYSVTAITDLRTNNPYVAVRTHLENVLKNLTKISSLAEKADVGDLVKRIFIEY